MESFLRCELLSSATKKGRRARRERHFHVHIELVGVGAFARLLRDAKRHLAAERNVASDCEKFACSGLEALAEQLGILIPQPSLNCKKKSQL
jgi:hypothetical protein